MNDIHVNSDWIIELDTKNLSLDNWATFLSNKTFLFVYSAICNQSQYATGSPITQLFKKTIKNC